MKKFLTIIFLLMGVSAVMAQYTSVATFNAADDQVTPDSLRAYGVDQGVRTVWGGTDLDNDGKEEVFGTDYSNGGRVHVFEANGNALELVWSSPASSASNPNSVPRWVRTGDLDGDGMMEIIFPHGIRYDGQIEVWEYKGSDNDYGTTPTVALLEDAFTAQGLLRMRLDRELAYVYDFDGDGRDELISANENNDMYILGVTGSFPGFGTFQVEGGNDAGDQQLGGGSWWHSFPADITGDGNMEIVSHYWNFLGFFSCKATAANTYQYPDTLVGGKAPYYKEYMADISQDAVAYMGIAVADVDGDGKDEFTGVTYIGSGDRNYETFLVNPTDAHDGISGWDQAEFSFIADSLWQLAGVNAGSHWGTAAYDFNENGRDEILLGGFGAYELITVEYNGSGDVMDGNNYDKNIAFVGEQDFYTQITFRDSAGVVFDTIYAEAPFVAKMFAGADVNNNGKKEVLFSFQSVSDSITYTYQSWDDVGMGYVTDSTVKAFNINAVNLRALEYTGATGFKELDLSLVTPDDYILEQNFPNPFNPTTNIRFSLPLQKQISLVVYDMLGREVKTIINNQDFEKGAYEVTWDGTNNFNQKVSSGNYIYTLKFGNFSKSSKMTLLK